MSLFKTRSWWATTAGFEEFHDNHSLAVGNTDNSADGSGTVEIVICPPKNSTHNVSLSLHDLLRQVDRGQLSRVTEDIRTAGRWLSSRAHDA